LALLAQPRTKHSNAVFLGDCGAIYGLDLGAGMLFHAEHFLLSDQASNAAIALDQWIESQTVDVYGLLPNH